MTFKLFGIFLDSFALFCYDWKQNSIYGAFISTLLLLFLEFRCSGTV